jgi:hypothetical protein
MRRDVACAQRYQSTDVPRVPFECLLKRTIGALMYAADNAVVDGFFLHEVLGRS